MAASQSQLLSATVLLLAAATAVNAVEPAGALRQGKQLAAKPVHLAAQRQKGNATAEAQQPDVDTKPRKRQVLRICNAHPDAGGLFVWQDDGYTGHNALTEKPMPPKSCREFATAMRVGDFLELRIPSARSPLYLPAAPVRDNTVALVVVYEKTKQRPGVWMHYFDHLVNAQVAAVNVVPASNQTKGGSDTSGLQLTCVEGACTGFESTATALPFGNVGAFHPGRYAVAVPGGAPLNIDAAKGGSYAVLLMGPGEAVVYPPPPKPVVYSGATSKDLFALLVLGIFAVLEAF
jgi:hypothetical protein